ncbi:MAG: NAD(P)H-hydrate epimerase [Planctomycetota bacterium]|jgi:NAD(P)H-hydrate epimerase
MPELTREQAREMDRIAMEELHIPGIVLMENAARGIAQVALQRLERLPGPVAVVCGPGNNGGDGLAAARHLACAGQDVRIHLAVPPEAYREGSDPAVHLAVARAMGLALRDDLELEGAALILDGIFGTGLQREVRGPLRSAIEAINSAGSAVLAIDLPSGLDADTGAVLGAAVRADVTATMGAGKVGFALGEGPALVGEVEVIDLGIPPSVVERATAGS